jgi:hypothetical protein
MQNTQLPTKFKLSPGMAFALAGGGGVILLVIALVILYNETATGIFCSAVWAVIFLPLIFRTGKRFITTSRVGVPEISLSNSSPRSGEQIVVNYQHLFKNAAELLQLTIQLILTERSTRGSGTEKTTKQHEFIIQELVVPGRHIEGGETFYTRQDFEIPRGVMHTFDGGDNELKWVVKIKVDFQGLPDLAETLPIQILPEIASH